ncbi:hypothetical protein MMC29_007423, partial [Sticta canariensis]|nr:hypothetical protein [Sticta canariensis]
MARKVTEDQIGIQLFYEPPTLETASSTASVDIIAIHGIGAHPDDTWRKIVDAGSSNERYVNWLRDTNMLPAAIPNARIMRYGYESHWFGETIKLKASTVAQRLLQNLKRRRIEYVLATALIEAQEDSLRPLIFIAHCFGGLVVLKAIVDAKRAESRWRGIYQSTCGILFFGTPFRGAAGLNQTELLRAIQSQYEDDQIQRSNLNILDPGNETLVDLVDMFLETRQEKNLARIACFFELKPSNVGAIYDGPRIQKFVVDESSGCLDLTESTEKYSLSRDHFNMNKFGKSTEEDFETVLEVIEDMVEQAPVLMKARNQEKSAADPDQSFQVPFDISRLPVTGLFVDRDQQVKEIELSLIPGEAVSRKVHVLYGLGGIGKTQLAIAYAREYQEKYSAIVWVNGSNQDTVLQSLAVFAKNSEIVCEAEPSIEADHHGSDMKKDAQAGLQWLARKENRRWLMIFDNVDQDYQTDQGAEDPDAYDLTSYFPRADHGSILVTTRLSSLGDMGKSTEVTRLNQEQAINILSNSSRLPPSAVGMKDLVARLGCLPLAIVQAGTYIQQTGTNCPKYQRLYNTSWSELLDKNPRLSDYANGSVQTTWMISYKRICQIDVNAAKLLQLWAHFHYHDLWFELFHASKDLNHPPWVLSLMQSEIAFMEVMKTLLAYSLIECSSSRESYSVHPVVHDWCRGSIGQGQIDMSWLALTIVGYAAPGVSAEGEFWLIQQRLLPHANQCWQEVFRYNATELKMSWDIDIAFDRLGFLYLSLGKPAEAEKMYQRALNGKEKALGPDHTSTLNTVNNLGILYENQGKLVEAEKIYQRALDGYETALGPDHISTLDTINNLGILFQNQGKLAEAEKMYQRALDGFEKALGPDHTSTLNTVNNLGGLYQNQGKLAEAEKMYQRALDGREKALGPDHTSTLNTVNNLGGLYQYQGKLAEAEKMYQRALDGREKALGPDHTSTLNTVNNLGRFYQYQGKLAEAEKMYQRALDGKEKALGPDHTSTLNTVNNLGTLYQYQGKLAEAEKMYQRALDGKETALGPDHTSTLDTVNNLGTLYENQGKLAEAEKMYQRALDGKETALGPDHTSTLDTVNNLGVLYENQGKLAEAEKMYQRALDGYETALGPDHTSTLNTVNNLGVLYENQGKLAEAEKMYQRALDGRETALGPDHTSTLDTVNSIGNLYKNQGKLAEAEKMYQRALDGFEKAWGPDHTSTLVIVNNLGILYESQGKLAEAERMYQRALNGKEKALGPDHTSTLDTVNNLSILYQHQGKLVKAEKMYQRALDGYETALGPDHTSTLDTVNNLGVLYQNQGKLAEAEKMYQRALDGKETALGPGHTSTLGIINNIGNLYENQGKLAEAEKMYQRALDGSEKALGPDHTDTLGIINNIGNLYKNQGKLAEAEK